MPPVMAPWRLLVLADPRTVLGTGFLISPELALTCAHVIQASQPESLWVQFGGPGARSTRARLRDLPATRQADVAVLQLDEPAKGIPPAPLGPVEPPPVGALLEAFGFPRAGDGAPDGTGIWAPVLVDGYDMAAERIQLTSSSPNGLPIQAGFSGGPVIDPQSDLVVGMISNAWAAQRIALMIPIRTIAACSPELGAVLLPRVLADSEFNQGISALGARNYTAALADFRVVCTRRPGNPDTWYYVALSALRGQRPRAHPTAYIEEIARLLEQAAALSPREPHVLALWALVKEDHYRARGISGGTPTVEALRSASSSVSYEHAAEICRHVPAPEMVTWQELDRRRKR
jgi:S1-C subfamily serine protease